MGILKCTSCGGIIEKSGNVFICTKCGEAFKDNANTFNLHDYTTIINDIMEMRYCSNMPKEPERYIKITCIADVIDNLSLLKRQNSNNPFVILEAHDGTFIQAMYESIRNGYIVEKSIEEDVINQAIYNNSELIGEQLLQRLFADFYTRTTTAVYVQWKKIEY